MVSNTPVPATGSGDIITGNNVSYTAGSQDITLQPDLWDMVVSSEWATPIADGYRKLSMTGANNSAYVSNQIASVGATPTVQQLAWTGRITTPSAVKICMNKIAQLRPWW